MFSWQVLRTKSGVRTGIARGKPEVMVCEAQVLRDIGTSLGEHKNAGFAVVADFIVDQRGPGKGSVDDHAGENAFGRAASADGAGGVQDVQNRILVAADVAKGDPCDAAARDVLQIEGPAAPAEDLYRIPSGPGHNNWPIRDEDLILVNAGPDEDLIVRSGVLERGAGALEGRRVLRIHDKGLAAGGIGWRFGEDFHSRRDVHGDYIGVKRGSHAGLPGSPVAYLDYALWLVRTPR